MCIYPHSSHIYMIVHTLIGAVLQFIIVVNSAFSFTADFTLRDWSSSNLRTNVSDTSVILQFNSIILLVG